MIDYGAIMASVLEKHGDADKWVGAPFEKVKRLSNSKVGDAGQDFIEELCRVHSFAVAFPAGANGKRSKQSPWDIEIESIKFELKTATEDVSNAFQFNHVRYARPYQALFCLGVGPSEVRFNLWSKADVTTGKAGALVSMEKSGSASYKLTKRKDGLHPIDSFETILLRFVSDFKP